MEESEQEKMSQHLQKALESDELSEKDYHIREALQLLGISEWGD